MLARMSKDSKADGFGGLAGCYADKHRDVSTRPDYHMFGA
jgi:hypothetical protein